jgi:hypothetical protein
LVGRSKGEVGDIGREVVELVSVGINLVEEPASDPIYADAAATSPSFAGMPS